MSTTLKRRLIAPALTVGTAVALTIAGVVAGSAVAAGDPNVVSKPLPYPIATNDSGQTYGSELGLPLGSPPDLILTYGDSGVLGYVYARDLYPDAPKSPAVALAQQADGGGIFAIPVYRSDGETKIDTFTVGGEESSFTTY